MNVQHYKNIVLPMLAESYDEREAANLFKYVLEDYFKRRYLDIKGLQLSDDEVEELNFIYEKIANHYPYQYIFHKAHFYGFDFYVDEQVLIPRPETEELVHWVITESEMDISVLDIGTGSGCIPITIKKLKPDWKVYGMDISEEALKIAQQNAEKNNVEINWISDDILNSSSFKIQNSKFKIIISNPPYIPRSEEDKMSDSTVRYEPHLALFVEGDDPLLFYRKIADFAKHHLEGGGKLFFELNEFNAVEVQQMLEQKGFKDIVLKKDHAGKDRMIKAIR